MTTELKWIFGTILASLLIIVGGIVLFNKPAPEYTRQELLPGQTAVLGATKTKVYLVEFSDFQCPACKAYKSAVDTLMKKYKDNLVFGYRHFPLPQHPFAEYAAYAAEAAGEQGKFWEMYDYIFANQTGITKERIDEGAQTLELDMNVYKNAVSSSKIKEKVAKDRADGLRFGVNSTPTFFLNGKKMTLNGPDDLILQVETALGENE